jgi:hypothetical protein
LVDANEATKDADDVNAAPVDEVKGYSRKPNLQYWLPIFERVLARQAPGFANFFIFSERTIESESHEHGKVDDVKADGQTLGA